MKLVVLGASGNAGREIARLLARELGADDELVLAGRDPGRLERTREIVAAANPALSAAIALFDAGDDGAVRAVVAGAGLVVVTASVPDRIAALARAVADAGADWLDTLLSGRAKHRALRGFAPEIARRGLCFVTDGGFHPGLPAAMVRWAAQGIETLTRADVMGGLRIDWRANSLSDSTVNEMLDEFASFDLTAWIDGRHRRVRYSECPQFDFGPPIGRKWCVPMPLEEMESLPVLYPSLKRCGFYIAGFSPFMDYAVLPVLMTMAKIPALRSWGARATRWSLARLASPPPPHKLVIHLDAEGQHGGEPATATMTVRGEDPYFLTAAPAVACIRRMRDGSARHPGLWHQAHLVAPDVYFADLRDLGLEVETRLTTAVR
jgi:hypothetical protein